MTDKTPEEIQAEEHAEAETAPMTSSAKLRAFEDEVFGKDVTRINGQIERGHGSLFGRLTHEQRAHHAALEQVVKTEAKVADASAVLAKAEAEHEAATRAADHAVDHIDGSAAE